MLSLSRVATAVYVLVVFTAGYVGVTTVHGVFNQASQLERLSNLGQKSAKPVDHTVLVMDRIEPSAATE